MKSLFSLMVFALSSAAVAKSEQIPDPNPPSTAIKFDDTPRVMMFKENNHTLSGDGQIQVCISPAEPDYRVGPNKYVCVDGKNDNAYKTLDQISPKGFRPHSFEYRFNNSKIYLFVYFKAMVQPVAPVAVPVKPAVPPAAPVVQSKGDK